MRRLRVRFEAGGLESLVSGRRGKPGNRQLAPGLAQQAMDIVHGHYADFTPTLAWEKLRDRHGLQISKETLRKLMIRAGLWIPRSERQSALHQPRERRECLGELVQLDGSRHPWFEQRAPQCTLLVYVDDATSRLLHLHFAETETTTSYFDATRQYLAQRGKPRAFYTDRAAVFRSVGTGRAPTQFERALDELGIALICANSPQAKGRVERMNRGLQNRLVKELRIAGISSIDAANQWCHQFIEDYNRQFGRIARSPLDLHVLIRAGENLARILAYRDQRRLSARLTVQHREYQYLLDDSPATRALVGRTIAVHTYADDRIELTVDGAVLPYRRLQIAARPTNPIEVDGKSLHHEVDKLTRKKKRNRPHRQNPKAVDVSRGVREAKKTSAAKAARVRSG